MKKNINHIFYKFEYKVNSTFNVDNFNQGLESIWDYRLNHDDPNIAECTWISYLSSFLWIPSCVFSDDIKKSLFFGRFVKWKYWDQIHLYSKTWDFSDIEEDTDFIWRESDKTDDEMIIRDFFYSFKLTYDSTNRVIKWIISRPTLVECMWKNELWFVVKNILINNFEKLEDWEDVSFWLEEILWQQQLNTFSEKWLTLSYVETKTVKTILDDLKQDLDGYDDSDTVDVNVSMNKTNSSKIKDLIRRFSPSSVVNSPIKHLVIKNDFWKIVNLDEFCYNFKIEDVELKDWIVFWESKPLYLKKVSDFIVEKVFPNI